MHKRFISNEYLIFFGVYLLANLGMFFILNSIYWDDWLISQGGNAQIIAIFSEQAATFLNLEAYSHILLLKVGPWIYRLLTLIFYFFIGVLFNLILKSISQINKNHRLICVILFLSLPLSIARIELVVLRYTVCLLLFMIAWNIYEKNKFISLFLFFISFNTSSLLVFYFFPVVYFYLRQKVMGNFLSEAYNFFKNNFALLFLPFIYYILKIIYYKPTGMYINYNQNYSIKNITESVMIQLYNFLTIKTNIYIFLCLIPFTYIILNNKLRDISLYKKDFYFLFFSGLILLIFGAFPYWILGHAPTFYDWSSRHQLLLPFGASLIATSFCTLIPIKFFRHIFSAIIALFISVNYYSYIELYRDWEKQKQVIELLSENAYINNASIIIFSDDSREVNAWGREFRFYEFNAMMYKAYNSQNHFALLAGNSSYENFKLGVYDVYFKPRYLAADFKRNVTAQPVCVAITNRGVNEHSFSKLFGYAKPNISLKVSNCY